MAGEHHILILAKSSDNGERFASALKEKVFPVAELTVVRTGSECLTELAENDYDFCFVSEVFSSSELTDFFNDANSLQDSKSPRFVCFGAETKLEPYQHFEGRVSLELDQAEREWCQALEPPSLLRAQREERAGDINSSIRILLRSVDEAANALKRGRQRYLDRSASLFLRNRAEKDTTLITEIESELDEQTAQALPVSSEPVEIGSALLGRELPNLTKDGYVGASDRVWKLINRLGQKEVNSAQLSSEPPAEDPATDRTEEERTELPDPTT